MIWTAVAMTVLLAGIFYMRMNARAEESEGPDAGLAIIEFGRAFPDEAIRQIHMTADSQTLFVRLHDGKAGCMRNQGHHYVCHLIEPGMVRVQNSPSGKGLIMDFPGSAFHGGTFEFRNAKEAAEVSLWLLGSFRPKSELSAPLASDAS
ncbi:hypothetical protein [Pararhizobium sp.]|uniref:hypothetical protein n=1 Tax=Pararhizobium sp. TaxID=1977563 RepID=UPI0027265C52|nr:hypothetical protein [Pararhizobium sp.]MDO9415361.1 hypothetical protein [Pararhizobium sp.]